jgi:hypothetical protein
MTQLFIATATLTLSAILMRRETRILKNIEAGRRLRGLL